MRIFPRSDKCRDTLYMERRMLVSSRPTSVPGFRCQNGPSAGENSWIGSENHRCKILCWYFISTRHVQYNSPAASPGLEARFDSHIVPFFFGWKLPLRNMGDDETDVCNAILDQKSTEGSSGSADKGVRGLLEIEPKCIDSYSRFQGPAAGFKFSRRPNQSKAENW
jgi:hypothetical protein